MPYLFQIKFPKKTWRTKK